MFVIRCSGVRTTDSFEPKYANAIHILYIKNFICSGHFKSETNIAFLPQPLWNFTHAFTEFHRSVFPRRDGPCSREQTFCIADLVRQILLQQIQKNKLWKAVNSTPKVLGEGPVQPMVCKGKVCLEASLCLRPFTEK